MGESFGGEFDTLGEDAEGLDAGDQGWEGFADAFGEVGEEFELGEFAFGGFRAGGDGIKGPELNRQRILFP